MPDQLRVQMKFPPGFLWGTATASHQVEGGQNNSWTLWENRGGGRIFQDQVSGAACEWWTGRAEEDFSRAASMNNNALRFSIEWSRIEPEPGRWDDAALNRYREMIADMQAKGLEPMVTLHHFTNPIWLEERGGWLNEDTPRLFARYAARVAEAFGPGVTLYCTINEPLVYVAVGYLSSMWPPGRFNLSEAMLVTQRLIQGHGAAYHAIKAIHPQAQIGLAKHQISFQAGTPVLGDLAARLAHYVFNEAFFGPFNNGKLRLPLRSVSIPEAKGSLDWIGLQYYTRQTLHFRSISIPEAKGTLDWIGLQFYTRQTLHFNPRNAAMGFFESRVPDGAPRGPAHWGELAPQLSYERIRHIYRMTRCPIYITEMGVPDADDSIRPGYLAETVRAIWKTCSQSFPVKGFFFWSLVDNFEWAEGYDPRFRFGLYGVDYKTQERIERRSARLYRAICGANALSAEIVRDHAPESLDKIFPTPHTP
jgi:beta-glucosidase